jgi:hypothetical protein
MSAVTGSAETSQRYYNYDLANDSITMSPKDLELAQKEVALAEEKLAKDKIEAAQLNGRVSSDGWSSFISVKLIYAIALLIFIGVGFAVINDDFTSLAFADSIKELFNVFFGSDNSN